MSAAVVTTLVPESSDTTATIERYQDAYDRAEAAVAFAETVKLGGIFVGGVVLVAAQLVFQSIPSERSTFPVISVLLITCAALLVLISQLVGVGSHIQGELLKATLDSEVNSSPFLSNAQRAKVMRLRKQAPVPESIQPKGA
jgi:hypothetical protein